MSTTIMTRPVTPVTASGEPEPRHDRAGTPTTPARPRNRVIVRANDACGLCGFWRCRCNGVAPTVAATDSDTDMDEALRRVRQGR